MKRTEANRAVRTHLKIASTAAVAKYALGGRLKEKRAPRPITLPKLKCLEAAE